MKSFHRIPWVKEKERVVDILLSTMYLIAYSPRGMRSMDGALSLHNYMVFSNGRVYADRRELERQRASMAAKGAALARYAGLLTRRFERAAARYERFLARHRERKSDYQRAGSRKLLREYREFLRLNIGILPYGHAISTVLEPVAEAKVLPYLPAADAQRAYRELVAPSRTSVLAREYASRLRLAAQLRAQDPRFPRQARAHLRRYAWLACYQPTDSPLSMEGLVQSLRKTPARLPRKKAPRPRLASSTPPHIRELVKVMRHNAWARTYRRELMSRGFFIMQPLLRQIAERAGVTLVELGKYDCREIERYLSTGRAVSRRELDRRMERFANMLKEGRITVRSGQSVEAIDVAAPEPMARELRGVCVSPGRARGRARIVHTRTDLERLQAGDVLVVHAVMTWMMPAIARCSAIVTEAGGALSHTATLAREFGKPCLIGVANVVDLLPDGTMLLVDADLGVVRITGS